MDTSLIAVLLMSAFMATIAGLLSFGITMAFRTELKDSWGHRIGWILWISTPMLPGLVWFLLFAAARKAEVDTGLALAPATWLFFVMLAMATGFSLALARPRRLDH